MTIRLSWPCRKTSEISQAIALNQTCSSLQSYSSLSSDDSSSSSYYYSSYYYSTVGLTYAVNKRAMSGLRQLAHTDYG